MPEIYLTKMIFGSYEDKEEIILYVGMIYSDAMDACMNFTFPNLDNNFGIIETWIDGKSTKQEIVRE